LTVYVLGAGRHSSAVSIRAGIMSSIAAHLRHAAEDFLFRA
jgi:hypothetical protein